MTDEAAGLGVHVDWLEFTVPSGSVGQVEELLREGSRLPLTFGELAHGMLGYEHQRFDGLGARVLSTERRSDIHVILSGQWCRVLSNETMRGLLTTILEGGYQARELGAEGEATSEALFATGAADESSAMSIRKGMPLPAARVTRIDLAFDDFGRRVTPLMVDEAIGRGECTGHVQTSVLQAARVGAERCGETLYIGSAKSRQRVRLYDKEAESEGQVRSIRWEIQAREEPAETLAEQLRVNDVSDWGQVWASRLIAICDFKEPGEERSDRRLRVAWFAALVGAARKVRAYLGEVPRTLEQVKDWIERQVSPSLALVFAALGGDMEYLMGLLERGRSRWKGKHRLLAGAWA